MRRHRTAFASGAVMVFGAAALVVFALSSNGYPVRKVDLNDGGIWVTNNSLSVFGRLNKPAGSLDAGMNPVSGTAVNGDLDTRQDGAAVVAWDRIEGKLYPVDVTKASMSKDQFANVGSSERVALAGGTLAVLEPSNGEIRAQRVDTSAGITNLTAVGTSAEPIATIDMSGASGDAQDQTSLAVGQDGTVFAVSASGQTVTVAPLKAGFDRPKTARLSAGLKSVQVTAVGSQLVVLDAVSGTLVLPSGKAVPLAVDGAASLQAPSVSGSAVVVSTSKGLLSIDLGSGHSTTLFDGANGTPAQPTWLGKCVYAAWPGKYVHACDGQQATPGNVPDQIALSKPVFRVNRGAIVLNDRTEGDVIDLESGQRIHNWTDVKPKSVSSKSDKPQSNDPSVAQDHQPPKALDDTLGARPGRTTVLHVLDNDSDPQGAILSICSTCVTSDDPSATLSVAPDGQTVEVTLPAGSPGTHFKYTVDDGQASALPANVEVHAAGDTENTPPHLRKVTAEVAPPSWKIVAGATISLPVLGDWRDDEGDPVVLTGATAPSGSVTTTSDGRVSFRAPATGGAATVTYMVSDGFVGDAPVPSDPIAITVLDPQSTDTTAPTGEPDVARGIVGEPITIHPLDNDLPGADPTNPAAVLSLAGQVASPDGLTVATDVKTGVLTVVASRKGSFTLKYFAAFGNASYSAETHIRLDVLEPLASPEPPVAMPDNAVLRGQAPNVVDVLANDFDPSGAVLVVQQATPVTSGQLQVAIVQGHWLRINALTPTLSPNPQLVRYTIADGVAPPTVGEVTVTQLPALVTDTPVPQDDYATVRAGDSVAVSVLDNDTNPGGSPITLSQVVVGAPKAGQLAVTPTDSSISNVGAAYISGQLVRYVAPPSAETQQTMIVDYVAQDPAGDQATGHLHLTVMPAPPIVPDLPPAPQAIEARVVAGDTLSIVVPIYGVDPEGDSVTVTAIGSAPIRGRVLAIGAASITYEAFPTSAGTDAFTYQVTDRYGMSGQATVRVAVVAPGDPQAPVAVDDQVTAAPGAQVQVDVLANDFIAAGEKVTIGPATATDTNFPDGVSLASPGGPLVVTAPPDDGKPLVVLYSITGTGTPSVATLTVHSQKSYNNPPRAFDVSAQPTPDASSVQVDVLSKDSDPEGTSLNVTPRASITGIDGNTVTVPVGGPAHAVVYEITDEGGATATAVIHVPAAGADAAPYAKAGQTITVDNNATTTVNLADYVVDPAGKTIRLTTTDKVSAAPAAYLKVANVGDTQLTLTGLAPPGGPAAISFEVTDGSSLDDPAAHVAFLTVPVQVGPDTPVLRCPTNPLTVIEGGLSLSVDVASVCHVWVGNKDSLSGMEFGGSWVTAVNDVSIDGSPSHILSVTALSSANPGDTGTISVDVPGTSAKSSMLSVVVAAAPPPTVTPITIDGFSAGKTATWDLRDYVRSQLRDPKISVVDISQTSGMDSASSASGSTVNITPAAGSHDVMTFSVLVTDITDASRPDRRAIGTITMNVLSHPDPPINVAPDRTVLSQVVRLSWTAPNNNGAPIEYYDVIDSGGGSPHKCAASPCSITGLTDGNTYTFRVTAHNSQGDSDPSAQSASATPDRSPPAVTDLRTSDPIDTELTLTWTQPSFDGTPVTSYLVSWPGGGHATVAGVAPGATATAHAIGLVNDNSYRFTVVSINGLGPPGGPAAPVEGQSAGKPRPPAKPTFTYSNEAGNNSRVAVVHWLADDPNGPAPTTYVVNRTGGSGAKTLDCGTALSCNDPGIAYDGKIYTYTVTAMNAAPSVSPSTRTSDQSAGTTMEATAPPDQFGAITPTISSDTADGKFPVSVTFGASHGKSSTVSCTYNGGSSCTVDNLPTSDQATAQHSGPLVLGFPDGTAGSFSLKECNGSQLSDAQAGATDCTTSTPISFATNAHPNAPSGTCAGDRTNNPTFQWGQPALIGHRTIVSYNYAGAINGSTVSTSVSMSVGSDGGWSSITVQAVDSNGELSAMGPAITCYHPAPPPPPVASILASQGALGSSSTGTCPVGNTTCHWLNFSLSGNFASGTYTWQCISNGSISFDSANYSLSHSFTAGQSYGSGYCIFGTGVTEAIRINNVTSNAVPHTMP